LLLLLLQEQDLHFILKSHDVVFGDHLCGYFDFTGGQLCFVSTKLSVHAQDGLQAILEWPLHHRAHYIAGGNACQCVGVFVKANDLDLAGLARTAHRRENCRSVVGIKADHARHVGIILQDLRRVVLGNVALGAIRQRVHC